MGSPAWRHERESRHARGYGTAWDRKRKAVMYRDFGLCQVCKRAGRSTLAAEVDHIVPKAKGGTDDDDNLQAICKPCHQLKTLADEGKRPLPVIGADGWPAEGCT